MSKRLVDLKLRDVRPILDYAVEHTKHSEAFCEKFETLLRSYPHNYHAIKLSAIDFREDLMLRIMREARLTNNRIMVDAEEDRLHTGVQRMTDAAMILSTVPIFKTYQMYRKDSMDRLRNDIDLFGESLNVKLVRGAYLFRDGGSGALHESKEATDEAYDRAIDLLLERRGEVGQIVFATHNRESFDKIRNLRDANCFHATLMGFDQPLGWKGDVQRMMYVPFGPYHRTYPYLLRRLYENPSVVTSQMSASP